jgi:hypothetical protein
MFDRGSNTLQKPTHVISPRSTPGAAKFILDDFLSNLEAETCILVHSHFGVLQPAKLFKYQRLASKHAP